jgi:hypothetical protein
MACAPPYNAQASHNRLGVTTLAQRTRPENLNLHSQKRRVKNAGSKTRGQKPVVKKPMVKKTMVKKPMVN